MRWCAACVILAGCNQIFGLKPTKEFDAAVDVIPEAPLPRVQLTLQVATVQPTGEPADTVSFAPVSPMPKVRIATQNGAFVDASYGGDGSIEYPQSFVGAPWRLEYTLGTAAPVEVQWAPGDGQGHVIVPLFGRVQRDPAPIGGGYKLTPSGSTSHNLPRVFTTGLWTETRTTVQNTGNLVETDFGNATSLSGGKGAPVSADGDRGLLVDFVTAGTGCRSATGSADFVPDLTAATHTPLSPQYTTMMRSPSISGVDLNASARLTTELHDLYSGTGISGRQLYGYAPSTGMPGFTNADLGTLLPLPMMLAMADCPQDAMVPASNAPAWLETKHFPRVVHAQLVDSRSVSGVKLTSGIEVDAVSATDAFSASFPAAIPEAFKLETPAHQMIDLAGAADNVAVTAASGTYVFSYTREANTPQATYVVDYTDVTLHEVTAGGLVPVRTFTFTGSSVQIDGSNLAPSKHYVFEVHTHAGVPMAASGDFTQITFPQGQAIVFTRTIAT